MNHFKFSRFYNDMFILNRPQLSVTKISEILVEFNFNHVHLINQVFLDMKGFGL